MRAAREFGRAGGALALLLLVVSPARAQLGQSRSTIDTGGATSVGGAFALSGTAGQPDAGVLTGGSFTLRGGFWLGGATVLAVGDPLPAGSEPSLALGIAPNPVRTGATLRWVLPRAGHMRLGIYDVTGRQVARLADGSWPAGTHARSWPAVSDDGRTLPAGIYLARLETAQQAVTRRVLIVR